MNTQRDPIALNQEQGAVLLMVEDSHADRMGRRYVARPTAKGDGRAALIRADNARDTGGYGYSVDAAGVAVVSISGDITPEVWAWFDGMETITDWVVRDLAAMQADPKVKAALFAVNSPGGYVSGAFELADAIAALSAAKPTASFIAGYGCSAAYLQASQTQKISAFRTSMVGSIGTRSAVVDAHAYFERMGVKIIPIDSGGMKSAGMIGTEITKEQLDYFRAQVNRIQGFFTQAVATGRHVPMDRAKEWADGRVHVAEDAQAIGLLDSVGTLEQAYQGLVGRAQGRAGGARLDSPLPGSKVQLSISTGDAETTFQGETIEQVLQLREACEANNLEKQPASGCSAGESEPTAETPGPATAPAGSEADSRKELSIMSQPNTAPAPSEPKAASMPELKAACTGAPSDFLVEQSEKGATADQAVRAYVAFQNAQIRSRDEELAKSKAAPTVPATQQDPAPAAPAARKPGVPAVESEGRRTAKSAAGEPVADFNEAVREQMTRNGNNRQAAIKSVCKADPDLHRSYLEATNPRKVHAMIGDRFGA